VEAKFIYLTALASLIIFVLTPIVIVDVGGGVPDIEPYGVFSVLENIGNFVLSVLVLLAKLIISLPYYSTVGVLGAVDSVPFIDVETSIADTEEFFDGLFASIDNIAEIISNGMNSLARIYSIIPIPVFVIVYVPLLITALYAIIKALPTT